MTQPPQNPYQPEGDDPQPDLHSEPTEAFRRTNEDDSQPTDAYSFPSQPGPAQQYPYAQQDPYAQQYPQSGTGYPGQQGPYPYPVYATPPKAQGITITALVLGIIAVFFGAIPFFGLAIGLAAVIVSGIAVAKKVHSRGMSIAGLIMGIFGLLIGLFITIMIIMAISAADRYERSYQNQNPRPSYFESPSKIRGGIMDNDGQPLGADVDPGQARLPIQLG